MEPSDAMQEPSGFELRELRRIITRHRRRHEQAERQFRDWQRNWSMNERVREEQLTRISNQLMDRLRNQAPSNGREIIEN
jgi:hypothetical protein